MGIRNGIADSKKYFQSFPKLSIFIECLDSPDPVIQYKIPEIIPQRLSVHEFHGKMDPALLIPGQTVNRDDGGVIQLGGHFRFSHERIGDFFLLPGIFLQAFDGDDTAKILILGNGNCGKSALGEFFQNGITAVHIRQRRFQFGAEIRRAVRVMGDIHSPDQIFNFPFLPYKTRSYFMN